MSGAGAVGRTAAGTAVVVTGSASVSAGVSGSGSGPGGSVVIRQLRRGPGGGPGAVPSCPPAAGRSDRAADTRCQDAGVEHAGERPGPLHEPVDDRQRAARAAVVE